MDHICCLSKLKINRTTCGLATPAAAPSPSPISSHCYVKNGAHEVKWTFVEASVCFSQQHFWLCVCVTGGYTSGWLQGHDGLQVDSLVSGTYSWPSWDEGMARRWGRKWGGQGTARVVDNAGQGPKSGSREDRAEALEGKQPRMQRRVG